jgi:hypothetical protein
VAWRWLSKIAEKMPCSLHQTAKCAVFLTALAVSHAVADPVATAVRPEKTHTGMIISVDPKERLLWVSGWPLSKKEFTIGDDCSYSLAYAEVNNNAGTAKNLRPGEKVMVSYQDWDGTRIADRIEQKPMRLVGTVKGIQDGEHTLVLRRRLFKQRVAIAPECIFLLPNDHAGALADIHPGDQVVVTYEAPHGKRTAREITKLQ